MTAKPVAVIAAAVLLTLTVRADTPDPVQILKKAQAAARNVQAVSYEVELKTEGAVAQSIPSQRGKVILVRPSDGMLKARVQDLQEGAGLELISDGRSVCMIDHPGRQYVLSTGPRARRALGRQGTLLLRELISDDAYAREIDARTVEYLGSETIGGVECDVVGAIRGEGRLEVRWYFGKADALPRRVERVLAEEAGGGGRLTMTLQNLAVDPPLSDELFVAQPPAGYTRTTLAGEPRLVDPEELTLPRPRESAPPSVVSGPERLASALLEVGSPAPQWTLPTPEGSMVALRDLRGQVVVLVFWATWSRDCRAALPGFQKLVEHYRGQPAAFYAINILEPGEPAKFLETAGYTFGLLLDGDETARAYGARRIPVFYVIGPDGRVLLAEAGQGQEDKIKQVIDQALKELEQK